MSDLPEGWTRCTIGSLCELVNGRAFKPSDWGETGLPIVRIQNLNNPNASFNRFDGEVRSRFLISSGALLFAWSGTPGTSFGAHIWGGSDAVLNQHIFNVLFDEGKIDKEFFCLAINQKLEELIDKAHGGVGLRHVTKGKVEATQIDLPPLAEQRRIVSRLDGFLRRSKSAREELGHLPKLVERYKQAVLSAAFRGKLPNSHLSRCLSPVTPSEVAAQRQSQFFPLDRNQCPEPVPGVTPFSIPVHWRWFRAEALCDFITKGTTPPASAMTDGQGEIPYLKVYNLTFNGSIDFNVGPTYVPMEIHNGLLRRSRVFPGDVLMNIVGPPLGKVSIVPSLWTEWNINQAIAVFRPIVSLNNKFLAYWLLSNELLRLATSQSKATAGQSNLTLQICRDIPVPLCSLEEQKHIVSQIDRALRRVNEVVAEAGRSNRLLERLDNAALQKAFAGEL